LEKTLHSRAERKTNGSFKNIGWWSKFSFCYLVTRKDSVMPSKDCVREYKVRSFAFYTGACAFGILVLTVLYFISKGV
jgi:hypothetical protein